MASEWLDRATRNGNVLRMYGGTLWEASLDYEGRPRPKSDLSAVERLLAEHPIDSLAPADRPYGTLAMVYAAAGQPQQARRYLSLDQKFQPREWNPPLGRSRYVEGRVLESEGRLPEALAAYQDGTRMPRGGEYCRECGDFYVGRVFDRLNQPDSALAAYDRAVNTPMLNRHQGESTVLGPTLRRMGELYEARGDREKAKEYYSKFVALWRDADSDFQPAVQDIKARLARLAAEPK